MQKPKTFSHLVRVEEIHVSATGKWIVPTMGLTEIVTAQEGAQMCAQMC